jgi:hypothetical protein
MKSAFGAPDGREAKGRSYGFVKWTFWDFREKEAS